LKALDIFLLLLLIWGGYSGYKTGFIVELFSLISFSIAKVLSIKLLHIFKAVYSKWYGHCGVITSYVSFGVFFITIVVSIILLGRIFRSKLKKTALGKTDKILGSLLGVGKWGFYASTFIWLADLIGLNLPDSYIANSILFPIIKVLSPAFISWLSNWLPILRKSLEAIKHTRHA
jgi:membrane protein required for colicin V production